MFANRLIVETVLKTGAAAVSTCEFDTPQTLVEVQDDLWRKVGRKPAVCLLAGGTARVVYQEGLRVTDTLDNLVALIDRYCRGELG